MKPDALYRTAAVLFFLFAVLHTAGFLSFKPPTEEGIAVERGMKSVRFEASGAMRTYGDFYRGFGLFCSVFLLLSAVLSWQLGSAAAAGGPVVRAATWTLCAAHVAGFALSCIYFFWPPALFSAVTAALLGRAAYLAKR